MSHQTIHTDQAPAAIGPYSQAVQADKTVYISGQIPLNPATGDLVDGDFKAQVERVFDNLTAVVEASGGTMANVVRVGLFLTDMSQFATVNKVMEERFNQPYPARAAIGVTALPKNADVEADAIVVLD